MYQQIEKASQKMQNKNVIQRKFGLTSNQTAQNAGNHRHHIIPRAIVTEDLKLMQKHIDDFDGEWNVMEITAYKHQNGHGNYTNKIRDELSYNVFDYANKKDNPLPAFAGNIRHRINLANTLGNVNIPNI